MARQLGINIEDYTKDIKQKDTGIGQQYEDFMIEQDTKDDKKFINIPWFQ